MTNPDLLKNLGLSHEKATVYLALLNHGPQTAISLSRTTPIKRTYIYHLCQELVRDGLLKTITLDRTIHFAPLSPEILYSKAEEKRIQAQIALVSLESLLPDLQSKYRLIDSKPTISYYEGVEGIKKVYLDSLKSTTPIFSLVEINSIDPDIYRWLETNYLPKLNKACHSTKAIIETGTRTTSYLKLHLPPLHQTKIINESEYPIEHETKIYDSKVSIIYNKAGQKHLGIIINNADIAKTFKSWFELTWNNLSS